MNIHDRPDATPLSKVRTNPPTKIGPPTSESQREWVASDTVRASLLPSGVVVVTVKRDAGTFGRAFHLASGGLEVELDCAAMDARSAAPAGTTSGGPSMLEAAKGAVAAVEEAHARVTSEARLVGGGGEVIPLHSLTRQQADALEAHASKEAEPAEPAAPGDKANDADPCASGHTPGELVPDACARCGASLPTATTPGAPPEAPTAGDGKADKPATKRKGRKPSGGSKA